MGVGARKMCQARSQSLGCNPKLLVTYGFLFSLKLRQECIHIWSLTLSSPAFQLAIVLSPPTLYHHIQRARVPTSCSITLPQSVAPL